jgi:hypothetical protein
MERSATCEDVKSSALHTSLGKTKDWNLVICRSSLASKVEFSFLTLPERDKGNEVGLYVTRVGKTANPMVAGMAITAADPRGVWD